MFTYEKKGVKTTVSAGVVYVNDINALSKLIIERDKMVSPLMKIGIDGGRGSLKVCMSIIDLDNLETACNSVKDVFLPFVAFGIQENKHNLRKILQLLNLDQVERILCIDKKMTNILCGLKSHSSTFPCCWCVTRLIDHMNFSKEAELRTVGGIIKYYQNGLKLRTLDENISDDTEGNGSGEENNEVVTKKDTFAGAGNYLLHNFQKNHPRVAVRWLKSCGLSRNATFGHALNGNGCRTLLKKAHLLKFICPDNNEVHDFMKLFQFLDKVVSSCFGILLDDNYLTVLKAI